MDLESLRDFLAATDSGGVTAGAKRRGAPKQTVSRRLRALEAALGVRLFDRSNRALRLTAEGQLLQERARRLIADDVRRILTDRAAAPAGLLRISAPVLLGQTLMGRLAARVLQAYPGLRLEIALSDRRVDLVEDGFDVAIRVGRQDDAALVGRLFGRAATIIVASPTAIERHGAPSAPRDLEHLPCILFGESGAEVAWSLEHGERRQTIKAAGRLTASSLKLCFDAACAGVGFANVPAFIAAEAIAAGALRHVLPEWRSGTMEMRLLYASRRLLSPRLRAFIDIAVETFAEVDFAPSPPPG
jgi:DNA-binding transcriptional LysR family regulator